VYSRNDDGNDVLLYGRVTWVYKKGGERSADFASKLNLVKGEKGWRLRSYQAFAVSACEGVEQAANVYVGPLAAYCGFVGVDWCG
jgi:hypothetical protein